MGNMKNVVNAISYGAIFSGLIYITYFYVSYGGWSLPSKNQLEAIEVRIIKFSSSGRSSVSAFKEESSGDVYKCYIGYCGDYTKGSLIGKSAKIYVKNGKVFEISTEEGASTSLDSITSKIEEERSWGFLLLIIGLFIKTVSVVSSISNRKDI